MLPKNGAIRVDEKRKVTRRRILKSGMIEFAHGGYSCAIRNFSENGAALDVPYTHHIPDEFELVTEIGQVRRRCRVTWRKENRLGVEFLPGSTSQVR